MKEVIGVIIFFLLAMTVGGGISAMFFTSIVGGGVSESYRKIVHLLDSAGLKKLAA